MKTCLEGTKATQLDRNAHRNVRRRECAHGEGDRSAARLTAGEARGGQRRGRAFSDFTARCLMGIGASQCSSKNIDVSVFAFPAGLTSGGNWTECGGYFFTVFNRSTAMLNQVRAAMGTADFFAAMRAHIADRRFRMTTTRALLDHLEAWDSASLTPIYRAYTGRY